jgi:nitroreductase
VALGVPGAWVAGAAEPTAKPVSSQELPFFEAIVKRRSVRKFKSTPVPEEHLKMILDAGRLAPTAGNQQPWRFLVVRDRTKIERIKQETLAVAEEFLKKQGKPTAEDVEKRKNGMLPYLEGVLSAPVHVLVLVDKSSTYPTYNVKDGSLAAGQIMLAARALGYGTVFLTDGVPEEASKRALAIPDRYERIALIPIGVPAADTTDGWPVSPPKKALDQIVAYETLT